MLIGNFLKCSKSLLSVARNKTNSKKAVTEKVTNSSEARRWKGRTSNSMEEKERIEERGGKETETGEKAG